MFKTKIMKSKLSLFVITISLFLSCSSNEDPVVSVSSDDIIGTWNLIDQTSDGTVKVSSANNPTVTAATSSVGKDFDLTFSFSENPNSVVIKGSYTLVVTATVLGQSNTQEEVVDSISGLDTGEWSVKDNILSITSDGTTSEATIEEFSGDIMKLKTIIDASETVDGITTTVLQTIYFTLQK